MAQYTWAIHGQACIQDALRWKEPWFIESSVKFLEIQECNDQEGNQQNFEIRVGIHMLSIQTHEWTNCISSENFEQLILTKSTKPEIGENRNSQDLWLNRNLSQAFEIQDGIQIVEHAVQYVNTQMHRFSISAKASSSKP